MKHKRPPIPVLIIVGIIVIAAVWFLVVSVINQSNSSLTASGTIEAVSVTISPEIGGKVIDLYVGEGDQVQAGDILFRMDDAQFLAQQAVARANVDLAKSAQASARASLATAQVNYDLVVASVHVESASTRTLDWSSGFSGSISQGEKLDAAVRELDNALQAQNQAQTWLDSQLADPASSDFATAEQRLLQTRFAFTVAQNVLLRASVSSTSGLYDTAQDLYDNTKDELDLAQSAYDDLKDTDVAQSILQARAEFTIAQERYAAALDRMLSLETGDYSLRIRAAEATLHQAEAAADQAVSAVSQAEAALALLDVQLSKLTITAPLDGIVQSCSIQPGEVIPVGSAAMRIINLDDLTITVYVPEDRYGEMVLNQAAELRVDSFPDLTFSASIIFIATEAEFTPRNVQTVEGRSSTVYGIRLRVDDSGGKLKPGMPADVIFAK